MLGANIYMDLLPLPSTILSVLPIIDYLILSPKCCIGIIIVSSTAEETGLEQ